MAGGLCIKLSSWNLGVVVGKTGVLGEKPLGAEMRINNKLNPHLTPSPEIEPQSPWWGPSALITTLTLLTPLR